MASLFGLLHAVPDKPRRAETLWPRLRCRKISVDDLLDDAFRSISRDGAANLEVQVFLHKGLRQLAVSPRFRSAVDGFARERLELALPELKGGEHGRLLNAVRPQRP